MQRKTKKNKKPKSRAKRPPRQKEPHNRAKMLERKPKRRRATLDKFG
jgi:hypothetical protein